jgi:hypothetical protein
MKSLLLFAGTVLLANMACATEITFSSSTSTTTSVGTTAQYPTGINGTWDATLFAGSSSNWISFTTDPAACSGDTGTQTVNKGSAAFCAVPINNTVTFTDTFNIVGTPSGTYTLYVLADDSASVTIDTHSVGPARGGETCATAADPAINCVTPTLISIPVGDLTTGSNTVVFSVVQNLGNSEFGLNFDLVNTSAVPEPSSFGMLAMGSALLGLAVFAARRKSQASL